MVRQSRSRSSRGRSVSRKHGREYTRSARSKNRRDRVRSHPRRGEKRRRSESPARPSFEIPEGWESTGSHYDRKLQYGLPFPHRIESTALTRKNGLAHRRIDSVMLHEVLSGGMSNWTLRLLANGRSAFYECFRSRTDSALAVKLCKEIYKCKELDLQRLLQSCADSSQDLQDWQVRERAISVLVDKIIQHLISLMPQDDTQKLVSRLAELERENARLKANQTEEIVPSQQGSQPTQEEPAKTPPSTAAPWRGPPPSAKQNLNNFFEKKEPPTSPDTSPFQCYQKRDRVGVFQDTVPLTNTMSEVNRWINQNLSPAQKKKLDNMVKDIENLWQSVPVANRPSLETFLVEWGCPIAKLEALCHEAHVRLLATANLIRA